MYCSGSWRLFFFFSLPCLGFTEPIQTPQETYEGRKNYIEDWTGHPGHDPLISDITFREICDHVIDANSLFFDPESVELGDLIYISARYLPWFESHVHDRISNAYFLITCDVGGSFPDPSTIYKLLFDPKLAGWFCKNIVFSYHPKLFQIPMGHHIIYWGKDDLSDLSKMVVQTPFTKKHFLYMNHCSRGHGDRDKIIEMFKSAPYCFHRYSEGAVYPYATRKQYYEDLKCSQFVISPPGLESDCVRNWEAFVLDCIPIIEHSFFDALFDDLPAVLIHNWEELNFDLLSQKYKELEGKKNDKAFFPYWEKLIRDKQCALRQETLQKQIENPSFRSLKATEFDASDLQDLCAILKKTNQSSLVYRSILTPMHAVQLAKESFIDTIYLYDPWLNVRKFSHLSNFLPESERLNFSEVAKKLRLPEELDQFCTHLWTFHGNIPIFLDLSYYRSSLFLNYEYSLFHSKPIRHSLLEELKDLYRSMQPHALLCGNMRSNSYVSEVLEKFQAELHLSIEYKGDFWFFMKPFEILKYDAETRSLETFIRGDELIK